MFLIQIAFNIPTNDGKMTCHISTRAVVVENTNEAAAQAFAKFIETCTYQHKDRATFVSYRVEKKLKNTK